ncbi:MAG: GspH/FimT family pseudopilin [Halioglobus sp.]|nr:GspH/FimT family pseudopilin [Halioglobus sp.]
MPGKQTARPLRGLGLIELLVVMVMLAVTLLAGTPVLAGIVQENRLLAGSQRLLMAVNLARTEAVMRNTVVSICPSAMARTDVAACAGGYAQGWLVFADAQGDSHFQAATDTVLRSFEGLPRGYELTNRRGTRVATEVIRYRPDGSAHRNLTLQLCAPGGGSISVVLNIVGRARLERDWGDCPERL